MTNPFSKTAEKGLENQSPPFFNSGQIFPNQRNANFPCVFFPRTQHISKLWVNEGACAAGVARLPKGSKGAHPASGRTVDATVLTRPTAFINNTVPITLGTSLDSCGMGNKEPFIPGLFKTAYIISHTNQILKCSMHPFTLASELMCGWRFQV